MTNTTGTNPLATAPIGRLLLKFAVPSTLTLIITALYNIVDQIFVGRNVGYLGNSATNVIYPLTVLIIAIPFMLGDGCAAFFSIQQGAGEREKASRGVCGTITLVLIFGILSMVLSLVLLKPLCILFGATESSLPYALEYGRIIAIGFPFCSFVAALSAIIRADGNPKFPMTGMIIGCVINFILDPLFIMAFHWGVAGAAWATILGQIVNALYLLPYLKKFKNVDLKKAYFKPNRTIAARIFGFGMSSCILQVSAMLTATLTNNMLVKYGALSVYGADIPMAAMGITMKVGWIVTYFAQGISLGAQPIIGYNYGAGHLSRVKKTFLVSTLCATVVTGLWCILLQRFPMSIISLFGAESELYNEFAVKCLRTYMMLCPCYGLQLCTGFFFQSVGKPVLASVNTLTKQLITIIPSVLLLSLVIGVEGPLWAGPVSDGISFLVAVFLLIFSWKKIFANADSLNKC